MRMKIIDNYGLRVSQVQRLMDDASEPFNVGVYGSLDDILEKLKVEVVIEPGVVHYDILDDEFVEKAKAYWERKKEEYWESNRCFAISISDFILPSLRPERYKNQLLLGCYKPAENVIILYPEAMGAKTEGKDISGILAATLAHETMHAYFDRPGHKNFPYAPFVEEPLAEFGSLLYLNDTKNPYLDTARVAAGYSIYHMAIMLFKDYKNGNTSHRKYLEDYKIALDPIADVPMYAGPNIILPTGSNSTVQQNVSVRIGNGQFINTKWENVFKNPPRYFYDDATKTLGLDGDWSEKPNLDKLDYMRLEYVFFELHGLPHGTVNVYLGDDFSCDVVGSSVEHLFASAEVVVSPLNNSFKAIKGILVWKKNGKPVLRECGDDLYVIIRDGKYGIINGNLRFEEACEFDYIWNCDRNGLLMVRRDGKYGLINKRCNRVTSISYDDIKENGDGTYTVKEWRTTFRIDKFGNEI